MRWTDRDIVLALTERYGSAIGKTLAIKDWPDENKRSGMNPKSVDAIAEAGDGTDLAIEVTRIESYPAQRRDDSRFQTLADTVLPAVSHLFPPGVEFLIPASAYPAGFKWEDIDRTIRDFLVKLGNDGNVRSGVHRHDIPGVPFPIVVAYEPELTTPPAFARIAPSQAMRRDALFESVTKALRHKASELDSCRRTGARSVLVLEHHDIALISSARVYAAFFLAKQEADIAHLTDVFFCRTDNPHRLDQWYCFLGPDRVLEHFNMPNFRFGPRHDEYWEKALLSEAVHYGGRPGNQ